MVKCPSDLHPVFTVSLNGVAIAHEQVKGAATCVQDFVRHPCSHRGIFSQRLGSACWTLLTLSQMLFEIVLDLTPGGLLVAIEAGPVIADLKWCREKIVSRREAVRDTREHWFSAETVASTAVGETAPRTTVRISDVVEVRDVQYVEEHEKLGLPCCSRSRPGKIKKRRAPESPGVTKKNSFLLQVRLLAVLHLNLLLRRVLRSRGRKKVFVIAVIHQFSKGAINNYSIVYSFRLLTFGSLVLVWIQLG